MEYNPPYGSGDPDAPYVDRNTPGAVVGSKVPAPAIEHPQREIVGMVAKSGLTPDSGDLSQLAKAVRSQALNYRIAGGSANALTATLDPAPAAWSELVGMPLRLLLTGTNSGAATLNVNGLGPKPIVTSSGGVLLAGDLLDGRIVEVIYDGSACQIVSWIARAVASGVVAWTTPGTFSWTVPAGVTRAKFRIWGGGGGGGGSFNISSAGSAGSGGGYAEGVFAVTPGQVIPIIVGSGGAGGAGGDGGAGGTSSAGSIVSATGGGGGKFGNAAIASVTSSPGGGVGGQLNILGVGGGLAYLMGANISQSIGGGSFGVSNAPPGITPGTSVAVQGLDGLFPGGGANGGCNGASGGAGTRGIVVVEY